MCLVLGGGEGGRGVMKDKKLHKKRMILESSFGVCRASVNSYSKFPLVDEGGAHNGGKGNYSTR